jgi:hypothetical protein
MRLESATFGATTSSQEEKEPPTGAVFWSGISESLTPTRPWRRKKGTKTSLHSYLFAYPGLFAEHALLWHSQPQRPKNGNRLLGCPFSFRTTSPRLSHRAGHVRRKTDQRVERQTSKTVGFGPRCQQQQTHSARLQRLRHYRPQYCNPNSGAHSSHIFYAGSKDGKVKACYAKNDKI